MAHNKTGTCDASQTSCTKGKLVGISRSSDKANSTEGGYPGGRCCNTADEAILNIQGCALASKGYGNLPIAVGDSVVEGVEDFNSWLSRQSSTRFSQVRAAQGSRLSDNPKFVGKTETYLDVALCCRGNVPSVFDFKHY